MPQDVTTWALAMISALTLSREIANRVQLSTMPNSHRGQQGEGQNTTEVPKELDDALIVVRELLKSLESGTANDGGDDLT